MSSKTVGDYSGRILIVDDEVPVGTVLQQWLGEEGYQAHYASDFEQVQQAFAQEDYDLVTLDIMMPGVDGLQILKWLRENRPDTGVIMATALSNIDTVLEAMRGGAINYLLKPFNMDLVSEEIARAMERQRLIAENRAYQHRLEELVQERTQQLQEAYARLQEQVRELEGRDHLAQLQMTPPESPEEAHAELLRVAERIFNTSRAGFYCVDGLCLYLVAALGWSAPGSTDDRQALKDVPTITIDAEGNPIARAYAEGKVQQLGGMAVPVLFNEETLGVLWLEDVSFGHSEEQRANAAWRLSREMALMLRMVQMADDLEQGRIELDELLRME